MNHPPTREQVGDRIDKALSQTPDVQGLTEGQRSDWLAAQVGKSRNTVDRWRRGESEISYGDMVSVARAVNQPLEYFAGIESSPSAEQLNEHLRRLLRAHKQRLADAQQAITDATGEVDALLAGL